MNVVFQSPSLRGSGRFRSGPGGSSTSSSVSIPFIAGQWSLQVRGIAFAQYLDERFNPLHCGAVVASDRSAIRGRVGLRVSIPFIAGQWSLRVRSRRAGRPRHGFQSPSLRGSGRFQRAEGWSRSFLRRFNPLHCGAVVASTRWFASRFKGSCVSIPFIAGQWSLRTAWKTIPSTSL